MVHCEDISIIDVDILEEPKDRNPRRIWLRSTDDVDWTSVQRYRIARPAVNPSPDALAISRSLDAFMHYLYVHRGMKDVCDEFHCESVLYFF